MQHSCKRQLLFPFIIIPCFTTPVSIIEIFSLNWDRDVGIFSKRIMYNHQTGLNYSTHSKIGKFSTMKAFLLTALIILVLICLHM